VRPLSNSAAAATAAGDATLTQEPYLERSIRAAVLRRKRADTLHRLRATTK
jgi:hypothetical protein